MPYTRKLEEAAVNIMQTLSAFIQVNTFYYAQLTAGINAMQAVYNRSRVLAQAGESHPVQESYCQLAVTERRTVIVHNTEADPRTRELERTKHLGACSLVSVPIMLKDGRIIGALCAMDDQLYCFSETEVRLVESMASLLSNMADSELHVYIDSLTGFHNREYLSELVENLEAHTGNFGVLFLDIDHFKDINDTYGHKIGDKMLKAIAKRIRRQLQHGDEVIRLGGDEFVILTAGKNEQEVIDLARRIGTEIEGPVMIDQTAVYASASIGVSFKEAGHKLDMESMVVRADRAMHQVKLGGKNDVGLFSKSLEEAYQLELDLKRAIENDELTLYYQPMVNGQTKGIEAIEALVRWQHRERGTISPLDFLPIAERTGLIFTIGENVFRKACDQALLLQHSGCRRLEVYVNFSKKELKNKHFIRMLERVLKEKKVDPGRIGIEISENIDLQDVEQLIPVFQQITQMGMKLALDDFGSGVTTLGHLKQLPASMIKIDMTFIRDIHTSDESLTIVKHMIRMAKNLNRCIVAEGVELAEQAELLSELGIDYMQGYYFHKPMPETVWAQEQLKQAWGM